MAKGPINSDNFGYYRFTGPARMDKELNTLRGMLKGMKMDGTQQTEQIRMLVAWADNCRDIQHRHPFNEIAEKIDLVVEDDILEADEVEDLLWLCEKMRQNGGYYARATADMQELQGMLTGIL